MYVQTVVVREEVQVRVNGQRLNISQYELQQALQAIGQTTEQIHSNRLLAQEIARRYASQNETVWTYDNVRSILLTQTSTISDGDRFVPRQNVYPHFHIGSNFITLSLASNTHIDLIKPHRTAHQFFAQLRSATISQNQNGKLISKLLEQLRNLVRPIVEIVQIDKNGNQTSTTNEISQKNDDCAIM